MGASYGKLTPAHREAIYDLKKGGATGRVIREKLAAGYKAKGEEGPGLDPVDVSGSECNRIARRMLDERDQLYTSKVQNLPVSEGLAVLTKRLIVVAEKEVIRLERAEKAGRLDANKLGRLATALLRLHALDEKAQRDPDPPPGDNNVGSPDAEPSPSAFADQLADAADAESVPDGPPAPPVGTPPALADQVLTGSGAPRGRPPTAAQSVPPGLPLPAPQGGVATTAGPSAAPAPAADVGDGGTLAGVDSGQTI